MNFDQSISFGVAVLVLLLTVSASVAHPATQILIDKIDAKAITKGLPITERQTLLSGNGRKKQLWKIKGVDYSKFEIIGDLQSDADLVGWSCSEFDKNGNLTSPVRDDSFCRLFFISVLKNVVNKPESVANDLIIKSARIKPQSAILELDDISIETDGQYYFIRRISRM